MDPLPELAAGLLAAAAGGGGGGATEVAGGGGAAAAELAVPPVMGDAAPVPFWAMAICWKSAWVLDAVGLMEKVMPFPQWPFCLQ